MSKRKNKNKSQLQDHAQKSKFAVDPMGIFLIFMPAFIGGLFGVSIAGPSWLLNSIIFTYIFWGWLPAIIGIIMLIASARKKRVATASDNKNTSAVTE